MSVCLRDAISQCIFLNTKLIVIAYLILIRFALFCVLVLGISDPVGRNAVMYSMLKRAIIF